MTEEQASIELINFRFTTIQIISKRVAEMQPEILNKPFNFQITVEIKVQAPSKLVIAYVYVKILFEGNSESVADFTVACGFQIDEFAEYIKTNDAGIAIIPQHFDELIRPISISTARGVIYSDLRGTYLQNAIMPVIFMDQFKSVSNEELDKYK